MPIELIIVEGQTTIGLATQYGHLPETVWNDPANAELKSKRKDMNLLVPGDKLTIPDKRLKEVSKPDSKKHSFKRKSVPAKWRLQLFDAFERPRANQKYELDVDGKLLKGTTDGDGILDQFIAPNAQSGLLTIGEDDFTLQIQFGHLEPNDELRGLQQRLNNLGYPCGEPNGELNEATCEALKEFQQRFGLKVTGKADSETKAKVESIHDKDKKLPPPPKSK